MVQRGPYPERTLRTRAAWRRWLEKNHARSRGVWFVQVRKASGEKSVAYDDCAEEALCFGWIDRTIRKLHDIRAAHLVNPRTNHANRSELNQRRMEKLIAAGRVAPAGRAVFRHDLAAKGNVKKAVPVVMPDLPARALRNISAARATFASLARTCRRRCIDSLASAKREETRALRRGRCCNWAGSCR